MSPYASSDGSDSHEITNQIASDAMPAAHVNRALRFILRDCGPNGGQPSAVPCGEHEMRIRQAAAPQGAARCDRHPFALEGDAQRHALRDELVERRLTHQAEETALLVEERARGRGVVEER